MSVTFITIQEASEISGKSIQTIRRAIKARKVSARKKKTPQGYNYAVSKESLVGFYKLKLDVQDKRKGGIKKTKDLAEINEYATFEDLKKIQKDIEDLMSEQHKAKESFMRFMKTFQERFVVLENQLKLLEEPKAKLWYQFWR